MTELTLEAALAEIGRTSADTPLFWRPTKIVLINPTDDQRAAARHYMATYYPDEPMPEGP